MRKESQVMISDLPLRRDQFALILMDKQATYKLFPIDTRDHIIDSCNEFEKYASDLSDDEKSTAAYFLKQACLTRGFSPSSLVEKLGSQSCDSNVTNNDHVAVSSPVAQPHHYALGGQYVIDTTEHIKLASEYFNENMRDFEAADRRVFAQNVAERSRELGADPGATILKYASVEYNHGAAKQQLLVRQSLAVREEDQEAYEKLAEYIPELTGDELSDLMGRLDKRAGLDRVYGRHILDPLDSVYSGMDKVAESPVWTDDINGRTYSSLDLRKALANPQVALLYGKGLVSQLSSNPEGFMALPKTDRESIMSYAN
jgi:hypothetical protein